ncbi:hypothetical protein [Sphingomonas hylomeconis]|uniref:DUF2182 domain-containing protein n=1 Tax=Sphingomonas hylomeconis TaxID=1395958 RepID=A0ABV7SRG2_9SPHN|nr:hypothetical protein [Sphingomonas hylomeconis]
MTLATTINLAATLAAFALGAWLTFAGVIALAMGEFEPLRKAIGEALFIRCAITMILVGLVVFAAGAAGSARLMA